MKSLDVLIYSPYYKPGYKGGGPIKSIYNMTQSCKGRINFKIVTLDRDLGDLAPYIGITEGEWSENEGVLVKYLTGNWLKLLSLIKPIWLEKYDVLYLNSFFSFKFSILPLLISKFIGRSVVVAPRGEFSEGALALKSLKKKIFITMSGLFKIHENITFQATSEQERMDIRRLYPKSKVELAENITLLERSVYIIDAVKKKLELRLVFLSRISPKKNLLFAINSLKGIEGIEVTFDIFGPVEDEKYWELCIEAVKTLPVNVKVVYRGGLTPREVPETLAKYDAFYFPTLGENYGHVIVEALLAGLPLIITDLTPWRNLKEKELGWDLSLNNEQAFRDAIVELSRLSQDEYSKLREGVSSWASNYFCSTSAVDETYKLFFDVVE